MPGAFCPRATMHEKDATSDKAPYLRIERLKKQFGSFWALKDISLQVFPGEFVCFLGPSGCGKTTLLRAIAGLDIQTSGRIFQADKEISNLPASQRDFGIVFQSYALFPNLTVADNVGYGLVSRRMPKVEIATRVTDLLRLVGLPDSGPKYPAQLSGGMQQRVALARALALSPGLLLLDEPLSALDARVRAYLRLEIRHLHRRLGVTTIMVTHDQEEALTMADRIVVMNQGVIEQVGTPLEVYREPTSAFVADFVGKTNLLPGIVVKPGLVRYGAMDLSCSVDIKPGPGSDVTLAIRPEDVVVRNVDANADNTFAVRVAEMEFLGSFCRVGLALNGNDKPSLLADFSINTVRDLSITEGMQMLVGLPSERIRVFPGAPKLP
jgi:iron(III) transport system ATP-binding protein